MKTKIVLMRFLLFAELIFTWALVSPAQDNTPTTALEIYPAVELVFPTQIGMTYQLQYSVNLPEWVDLGAPVPGTGLRIQHLVSTRDKRQAYYRVVTMPVAERPLQKAFKGIELYRWLGPDGCWSFSLLLGTNRTKTEAEIKEPTSQINSLQELEQRFLSLAIDEEVCWCHQGMEAFVYPEETLVAEVIAAARRAKINLHVP